MDFFEVFEKEQFLMVKTLTNEVFKQYYFINKQYTLYERLKVEEIFKIDEFEKYILVLRS